MTDKEITNLKKHLKAGDEVYFINLTREVKAVYVDAIGNDGIHVSYMGTVFLPYETYRNRWFLTERVAREAAGRLGA